ncbi:unnamed protein product [Rotaria sp. Silwood1]|nr:unnamed protein product [Rotaria sp. Silwood1]CAF1645164.1 unnamed protein product [Rotaria sp. Silwood1]
MLSVLILFHCVVIIFSQRLIYSHFDNPNDKDQFKIDFESGNYTIEASWYKAYSNAQDGNAKGRSELRRDNIISGNGVKRYFKAIYFIPNNLGNQAGIIGQGIEQVAGAPWNPIFFWMAWPGNGVELSVYAETGPNPIIKKITTEDPRGRMHTIEMWAYFTTNNDGWMDVRYDNGPVKTIYSGKTLPTGRYPGAFKVGTYAGYNGKFNSEVWVHMLEVIANGAPPNSINGHSF